MIELCEVENELENGKHVNYQTKSIHVNTCIVINYFLQSKVGLVHYSLYHKKDKCSLPYELSRNNKKQMEQEEHILPINKAPLELVKFRICYRFCKK